VEPRVLATAANHKMLACFGGMHNIRQWAGDHGRPAEKGALWRAQPSRAKRGAASRGTRDMVFTSGILELLVLTFN
jgi:hypothetical protein